MSPADTPRSAQAVPAVQDAGIFCRNVMIYFDKPTQLAILEKFAPLLPDGLLFAGHSESLFHAAHLFRPRGRTVYEPARRGMAAAADPGRCGMVRLENRKSDRVDF